MCRYLTHFESAGIPKGIAIKMSIISITYYARFCSLRFLKQVISFTIFFASWEFRNSDNTVSVSSLLKSPARKKLVYFLENRSKQLLKF